ncbi:MAG TPA: winged helix-turn-helix domain-containing protein [Nitrospira sp.]|nr:winged helix-turn-helix domain-containing protein [Nitrospira sp.]
MANKRLGTAATELKLPTKSVKGEKKPKWQAKTGNKKSRDAEVVETPGVVVETTVQGEITLPPEPTEVPVVATTPEGTGVEPATVDEAATTTAPEPTSPTEEPSDETTHKKPRKLKVKADGPPRKLSMVAAALRVLQERKVSMTCPELIDVMATEGLWVSPGGKTPANTLYAAISRIIKEQGKASAFRKGERGRFEAV